MLDHANLNTMSRGVIGGFSPTRDDDSLLILPLFHVNGIVVGTLSPLLAGAARRWPGVDRGPSSAGSSASQPLQEEENYRNQELAKASIDKQTR